MRSNGPRRTVRRTVTIATLAAAVAVIALPAFAGPTSPSITEFRAEGGCVKGDPAIIVYVETVSFQPPTSFGFWVDGDLTELPTEFLEGDYDPDYEYQYVAASEFVAHLAPGTYDVQVSVGLEDDDGIDYGTTYSDELQVTVPSCQEPPLCEAGDRRYGKRILDCLGMPYGQVIRDRALHGSPDAEGARQFWVHLNG